MTTDKTVAKKRNRNLLIILSVILLMGGSVTFFLIYAFMNLSGMNGFSKVMSTGDKIAIIKIEGVITQSDEVIKQIEECTKNDNVKGLLVRVNSPGGAVAPSQEIYDELVRFKKSGKKLVVSMGSLAASGGYYIAAPADKIIANPGTITGSIGVIINFTNFKKILEKVGIKNETIKSGKLKDVGSPFRDMTPEEKAVMQGMIDNVYEQFVTVIAKERNLSIEEVKHLADGRIYSGEQAVELKLVDQLGNLHVAKDVIMELTGITNEKAFFEKKKEQPLLEKLIGEQANNLLPFNLNEKFSGNFIEYRMPY